MQKKFLLIAVAGILAVAVACGGDNKTPVSPTPAPTADTEAAADGSTLKVSAPTPRTPANGSTVDTLTPVLTITNATGRFVSAGALVYRFVIESSAGSVLYTSGAVTGGATTTSLIVPAKLFTYETNYRWKARAEQGAAFGPWSGYFTLRTPNVPVDPGEIGGYIRANEIWDPLTKGVSVGIPIGMEFSADGARTVSNTSRLQYNLLQTLSAGEFSFYAYNINPLSVGDKTKLFSMMEGGGDITTNDYRWTFEKRGSSYPEPGTIAWRIINGDSTNPGSVHDIPRFVPNLVKARWYFVKCTWAGNSAQTRIFDGGPNGPAVVSTTLNYPGRVYGPTPHVAFIGAPVGRAGQADASVPNMTVKQVFIGGTGTTRPTAMGGGTVGIDW